MGGGGKGGGGGQTLSVGDAKELSQFDANQQRTGFQGILGGGTKYVEDKNSPSGWKEVQSAGSASQGIINNSLGALGKQIDPNNLTNDTLAIGQKELAPYFQQQQESLNQRLARQGIDPNSDVAQKAQKALSDNQGSQINQYALSGREQEFNNALKSQQQASSNLSTIVNANTGVAQQVAAPNTAGAYNQSQSIGAQNNPTNSLIGALGSVGSGLAMGAMMSDERVKENIRQLGTTHNGLKVVGYNFKHDPDKKRQIGLLAQDVEKKVPGAVVEIDGIKHVHYDKALKK